MSQLFTAIHSQMFSPVRSGNAEFNKQLISAYFTCPGECVLDVGAHSGNYASYYASFVGRHGEVYAFEAAPLIFEMLKRRVAKVRNITCVHAAVSDQSGKSIAIKVFPECLDHQCSTVEPAVMNADHIPDGGELVSVPTLCLDDLLLEKERKRCCLIKIDVEGHEEAVLKGGEQLIRGDKPIIIYEYLPIPSHFIPSSISVLEQFGYLSYDCKTLERVENGYESALTDLVAIPKDRQSEFEALARFLKQ